VEVDFGTGFEPVSGDPVDQLDLVVQVTSGITSGVSYPVRYRVANIYGWGDYSPVAYIIAAVIPSEPLNVVTSNVELETYITVSWDSMANPGGNQIDILEYQVLIARVNGVDFD
jgi:hypothetical protein